MGKRLLSLLLVGLMTLAGWAIAADPPQQEEPPVRLKKKRARPEPPKTNRQDAKKTEAKKKTDKKDESAETEPALPEEDEKEVLQRVSKNLRSVDDKLAKLDLGEDTRQTQRDILKDLEALLQRGESPPQGDKNQDQPNDNSGAGQNDQRNSGQQDGGPGAKQRGQKDRRQQAGSRRGGKAGGSRGGKPRAQRGSGQSARTGGDKTGQGDKKSSEKSKGNNGGGANGPNTPSTHRNADLYKNVWGHLPESLRGQMNAYSNPEPFLPRYDDLIKRYYRTIAEQGRRKGE